ARRTRRTSRSATTAQDTGGSRANAPDAASPGQALARKRASSITSADPVEAARRGMATMLGAGGPYPAGPDRQGKPARPRTPLPEEISVPAGTLYRRREGMWPWVAHRVTGVLIFFFLLVHGLDTALVRVSPEAYDTVVATYKTPIVALLEYGLVAAILFHALNGLRVIAVDFWIKGARYQKQMLWTVVAVWVVLMLGAIYPVLGHAARELFGS